MSETPDITALLENVLLAAEANRGRELFPGLRDAVQTLMKIPNEFRPEVLSRLGSKLDTIGSPTGAGFLAVWLGAAVERGRDPALTASGVCHALMKWSRTLRAGDDEDEAPEPVGEEETLVGLEFLGQAAVAHLARYPAFREELAHSQDVVGELERTSGLSVGAMWVLEVLRKQSGVLVVLHIERRRGFRVSYRNIGNCFHLFTLLQGALAELAPAGEKPNPRALAVARGEESGEAEDNAWWHYGQGTCPKAELAWMVYGEPRPDSIDRVGGEQVLLLWPPLLGGRGWDAGFFGPHLVAAPAEVSVMVELSPEDVSRWWMELRLPGEAA